MSQPPGSQGESLGKGNGKCKGPEAESSLTSSRHRGRWETRGDGETGRTRFLRAFLVGPSPIKKFKMCDKCDGKLLGFFKEVSGMTQLTLDNLSPSAAGRMEGGGREWKRGAQSLQAFRWEMQAMARTHGLERSGVTSGTLASASVWWSSGFLRWGRWGDRVFGGLEQGARSFALDLEGCEES